VWPTFGSEKVTKHLFEEHEEMYKGMWAFEANPAKAAQLMIAHIDKKRKALGLEKARGRVFYDMAMRRAMA
jgi:carbon-monoxide dehydrogenase catalytic subunit